MGGKKMEGDENQKRARAREAKKAGKKPSEVSGTTGASKQITQADKDMSHEDRLHLKREGKQDDLHQGRDQHGAPDARPRSRENEPADQNVEPRM